MTILSTLRAGAIAVALAGTALTAIPAQAAQPTFGLQLNLGGGGIVLQFGDKELVCLSDKQIVKALNNKGYSKVKIVKTYKNSNKVWAIGRKSGDWFQMRVDRCTGKVDKVKEIYPEDDDNLSFNLTFTF